MEAVARNLTVTDSTYTTDAAMKVLFVHDRFGAKAGAESNLSHTAAELKRRGHELGLVHGPGTNEGEEAWRRIFPVRFEIRAADTAAAVRWALAVFQPDVAYVHNTPDLAVVRGGVSEPQITVVDYHDIVRGRAGDVALEPHDIVYVPLAPCRVLTRYVDLILTTFARTIGVNAGARAVSRGESIGISVPVGP